jgi:hypothetical protein
MKTMREVLEVYDFKWDDKEEIWVKKGGFGRKSTVDVMFRNLFIIHKNGKLVYDHYIESFGEFSDIIRNNFG